MKKIGLIGVILCLAGLLACEQEADSILVPYQKKLVVECYLNPGETNIQVIIRSNEPMLGVDSTPPVTNATVQLSNGQQTVTLPYRLNVYQIAVRQFPLVAGTTYTLKVSAPGFTSIEAQCVMPTRATGLTWQDKGLAYEQRSQGLRVLRVFNLKWGTTIPTETQYFSLGRQWRYSDTTRVNGRDSVIAGIQTDWDQFLTDTDIRANSGALRVFVGRITPPDSVLRNTRTSDLLILQTDKNVYDFMRAVQLQRQNSSNPFAEPSLIPSNIKNGLGVFGPVYLRRQTVR